MSARSDGIEAYDRGEEVMFDCPYKFGEEGYNEWVDGFNWSRKIELEIELPEMY